MWWHKLTYHLRTATIAVNSNASLVLCRDAADDAMIDQILASTQHPLALDAFVSILFAPQAKLSFDGMVEAMRCPVCMIYGKEDPWVVPLWGQRLKRLLADAVYLEVSMQQQCNMLAFTALSGHVPTWWQSSVLWTCHLKVAQSLLVSGLCCIAAQQ